MNDNAEKWVIPEPLWRDLLVVLRLNDWPVTSEVSSAARDRLVRWVESRGLAEDAGDDETWDA